MNSHCPHCGLQFEREPGYFVGAMYISYTIAVVVIGAICGLVTVAAPERSFEWRLGVSVVLALPLALPIFRSSRVLWLHFDRAIDA